MFASGVAGGVRIYKFEPDGMLGSVGVAAMAGVTDDQQWRLDDFRESRFEVDGVQTRKQRLEMRRTGLNPDLLRLSVVDPGELSGIKLLSYVRYLQSNGLKSERYEIALWARAAKVVSIFVMCLLALPFVFGSLRSAGAGTRVVIGVLVGVGYYLVSNTLASSGTVYGVDPLLTAWLPTIVLATTTAVLLARAR
jgi:lipopolysaccharide export system permease protein